MNVASATVVICDDGGGGFDAGLLGVEVPVIGEVAGDVVGGASDAGATAGVLNAPALKVAGMQRKMRRHRLLRVVDREALVSSRSLA